MQMEMRACSRDTTKYTSGLEVAEVASETDVFRQWTNGTALFKSV